MSDTVCYWIKKTLGLHTWILRDEVRKEYPIVVRTFNRYKKEAIDDFFSRNAAMASSIRGVRALHISRPHDEQYQEWWWESERLIYTLRAYQLIWKGLLDHGTVSGPEIPDWQSEEMDTFIEQFYHEDFIELDESKHERYRYF